MYKTIQKYIENDECKNGLMLLDLPTGSGKTYNVLQYIYDAVKAGSDKRYFFITTLKKNLPREELKDRYIKDNREKDFDNDFLFINSNYETVLGTYSDDFDGKIPYDIKNTEEYQKFQSYINGIKAFDENASYNSTTASIKTSLEDEFRKFVEPSFRNMVEKQLAKQFKKRDDRLFAIKADSAWQWVGELYPAVFTREKKIIFLSMDKFLARNNTLIESSYLFYNSDILDDAIVFIDEVDATKETILNNLIENGLDDKIDYLELFNKIYYSLENHIFPTILTTPSKKRIEGKYKDQSLQEIINKVKEIAVSIYGDYKLEYSYKTIEDDDSTSNQNFLFQDHQYHSIGKHSWVTKYSDYKEQLNRIKFTSQQPKLEQDNVHTMLGRLRGFITYFQNAIKILANNYCELRNERRRKDEDEFTLESAVSSILEEFNLDEDYITYLTIQILLSEKKQSLRIKDDDFDLTFYQNGFRYFAFENSPDYDMHSKIMMYSFQVTPEKLFLKVCNKAKVIGISATATVPTNLGNFDIDYIKSSLGNNYIEVSDDDFNRMKDEFDDSMAGYRNGIEIHTQLINSDNYSEESWIKIFNGNEELGESVYEMVEVDCANANTPGYYKERYLRIAAAYREFVTTGEIRSMLCVLNFHPKKNKQLRNRTILENIFNGIASEYNQQLSANNCVRYLDGTDYEEKKDSVLAELSNGRKIFVISVYQTIGAGQNLQYKIPKLLEGQLVKINTWDRSNEKDFDAIYLDRPTNLIVNLNNDNLEDKDFIKYIYQMEYLQEKFEISPDEALKNIKADFTAYRTGKAQYRKSPDTKSVKLLSTKILIQAIGRLCRTNMKSRDIYILADSHISDFIDGSVLKGRLLNPEFIKLINDMQLEKTEQKNSVRELENEANLKSTRANGFIMSMLKENMEKGNWNESTMKNWKELREFVLIHPTISKDELVRSTIAKNFYIQLPKKGNYYTYSQNEDYKSTNVSFTIKGNITVSENSCHLSQLMKVSAIKDYFEANGWATSFEENEYIMCPTLFNNIYKGALGEVVGKFLFECAKCSLEEIENPSLFEKFDYKVVGKDIYVDFKNWHETTEEDLEKELEKITNKAKECGAKTVVIANILTEKEYPIRTYGDEVKIVIIPSLLLKTDQIKINPKAWSKIVEVLK